MRICYLGSELETHFSALNLVLEQLRQRGHEVIVKQWHYINETGEKNTSGIVADLYLAEMTVPEDEIDKFWIQLSHGISPYKLWKTGFSMGRWKTRLVPTSAWKEYGDKFIKHQPTPVISPTDGWCKMDLYYIALQNRDKLRSEIYTEYKFDIEKPLVVYAPTGTRLGSETKKEWKARGFKAGGLGGYRHHGSYYHRKSVKLIAENYANYYEIPHPCVNRDMGAIDRINMLVASDLFIGDISSMSLEYTIVNKPIILLKKNIEDSHPMDFHLFGEYTNPIVDLGDIISITELESVLPYRLQHDDYSTQRNYWKQLLLGTIDGKCANREADTIEEFAKKYGIL